jgi:hypothetical protein
MNRWRDQGSKIAQDRLALRKGEGEGEGLPRTSVSTGSKTPHLGPLPFTRGEARDNAKGLMHTFRFGLRLSFCPHRAN